MSYGFSYNDFLQRNNINKITISKVDKSAGKIFIENKDNQTHPIVAQTIKQKGYLTLVELLALVNSRNIYITNPSTIKEFFETQLSNNNRRTIKNYLKEHNKEVDSCGKFINDNLLYLNVEWYYPDDCEMRSKTGYCEVYTSLRDEKLCFIARCKGWNTVYMKGFTNNFDSLYSLKGQYQYGVPDRQVFSDQITQEEYERSVESLLNQN